MRRRKLLAGTGLVLASAVGGCLASEDSSENGGTDDDSGDQNSDDSSTDDDGDGSANDDGDDSSTDDDGDDGSANDDGDDSSTDDDGDGSRADFERHLALRDVDDVSASVPVEFDLRLTESVVTPDGNGLVAVAATNVGEREREVPTPFYKGKSEGDGGIILHSLDAPDSPDRRDSPSCIGNATPDQEYVEWTSEGPLEHVLSAGETGTDELLVVDDPTHDGCFPPGEYRFETEHSVDGTEFTWGFTLDVSETASGDMLTEPRDRRYESCSREIVPYDQFPADVQAEIDAALEGTYESDRVFLREAMDLDESFLSVDGEYYEATVTARSGQEVLDLRLVDPKVLPRDRPVNVELDRDDQRTITIELVAEDGTVLVEETRDIWSGGQIEFGHTNRVGTHELRVTVADGDEIEDDVTRSARIDESHFEVLVLVEPEEVVVSGVVADLGICQYEP